MKFGRIGLTQAEGAILAHTTRLPGGTLPKGTILEAAAIERLRADGHSDIIGALLERGDVAEDEAARRLAEAILAPGLARTRPGTGRSNLIATRAGLFRADPGRIDTLNSLHEGLTIATLRDATPVSEGSLAVTVKIIPFAVPGAVLEAAEALAHAEPPLRVAPFRPLRIGLVLTELPGLKVSVLRRTVDATRTRVTALSGTMLPPRRVPHEIVAIADALRGMLRDGAELLLIASASATVDRGDVGPTAIRAAGGLVDHFGMPVDPGNLICLGHIGSVPALVLPGCARSPVVNGIDLVLARLFAGESVTPRDIAGLGVGGLLKEFAARPAPRLRAAPPRRIAAIVLAAGLSRRMAPHNKLLLPDESGKPMIARTVDAVLSSRARPVFVVVGHQAEAVRAALAGRDVHVVESADYTLGMSASLRAGLGALAPNVAAALICLGDMPLVTAPEIDRLLDAYDPDDERKIVAPMHAGQRGNPVLWDRSFFAEMSALEGDAGARALLMEHAEHVTEVELSTDAVLRDFDLLS